MWTGFPGACALALLVIATAACSRPPGGSAAPSPTASAVPAATASAGDLAAASRRPPDDEPEAQPYPEGCEAYGASRRRCDALVAAMARRLHVDPADAREIWLLDDPGCGQPAHVVCNRTTGFGGRVRFVLEDGRSVEESRFCSIEGDFTIECTEDPRIQVITPISGGYTDIPCSGEPPDGCASPVPSADPAALAAAVPLVLGPTDIPIDHTGSYDLFLGTAKLANGLLRESTIELVDDHQRDFLLDIGWIHMRIVPVGGGEPIVNVYRQGWRPGVEPVEVRLRFLVTSFDPGAAFRISKVVVR